MLGWEPVKDHGRTLYWIRKDGVMVCRDQSPNRPWYILNRWGNEQKGPGQDPTDVRQDERTKKFGSHEAAIKAADAEIPLE